MMRSIFFVIGLSPILSQRRFVLVGNAGSGKSAIINAFFGSKVAAESQHEVGTLQIKEYILTQSEGVELSLWDTPSLFLGTTDPVANLQRIANEVRHISALILTIDASQPRLGCGIEELRTIAVVHRAFGPAVWARTVIVFTKADLVAGNSLLKTSRIVSEALRRLDIVHVPAIVYAEGFSNAIHWIPDLNAAIDNVVQVDETVPLRLHVDATTLRRICQGEGFFIPLLDRAADVEEFPNFEVHDRFSRLFDLRAQLTQKLESLRAKQNERMSDLHAKDLARDIARNSLMDEISRKQTLLLRLANWFDRVCIAANRRGSLALPRVELLHLANQITALRQDMNSLGIDTDQFRIKNQRRPRFVHQHEVDRYERNHSTEISLVDVV